MSKKRSLPKSFGFAFEGLKLAFKQEPNFRIHIIAAFLITAAGIFFNISILEWVILTFTISFVIIAELINTAVESLVDIVSPEIKNEAKIAKDVLAAAVFVTALLAIVVGLLLFVQHCSKITHRH
jgi:diacylglycerol kinase